jgi:hypothetical protein
VSDAVIIAIVAGLPATIVAVATLVTAIRLARSQEVIAARLNGRLDQLVEQVRLAAVAEATAAELARQLAARQSTSPPPPAKEIRG